MTATPSDPADAKAALRKQAATHRRGLMAADPDAAARLGAQVDIVSGILADFTPADGEQTVVAAYMPIRSELSPLPLVAALAGRGVATAMPETPAPGNPLVFRRWAPGDGLVDGPYGTKQPAPAAHPDAFIDPGADAGIRWRMLAARLWRRFYDRTLARFAMAGGR